MISISVSARSTIAGFVLRRAQRIRCGLLREELLSSDNHLSSRQSEIQVAVGKFNGRNFYSATPGKRGAEACGLESARTFLVQAEPLADLGWLLGRQALTRCPANNSGQSM